MGLVRVETWIAPLYTVEFVPWDSFDLAVWLVVQANQRKLNSPSIDL